MKSIIFLAFATFFSVNVIAQNVGIGTATPTARLHIKGSADTTQLIVEAYSIQSNIKPLIKLRNSLGVDLMWIHSDHSSNIFIGINAGRANIAGFGGESNTFIGSESGYANTFGRQNTTNGFNALYSNTIGVNNTATGASAIYNNNIGSNNTALGSYALYANTTSGENTAVGSSALYLQS